jgi:hypothetical protein
MAPDLEHELNQRVLGRFIQTIAEELEVNMMTTNTQLVSSIIDLIESLPEAEQNLLTQRLFFDSSLIGEADTSQKLDYPRLQEVANLAQVGGSFDFLESEPDLYTIDDGEPVE